MEHTTTLYSIFREHLSIEKDVQFIYWETDGTFPRITYHMHSDALALFICFKGYVKEELNQKIYTLGKDHITVLLPEHTVRMIEISPDIEGCAIIIDKDAWIELKKETQDLPNLYSIVRDIPTIAVNDKERDLLSNYFKLLKEKLKNKNDKNDIIIVKKLLVALSFEIATLYKNIINISSELSKEEKILNDFFNYLSDNYKKHHDLEFYADKFNLSPKYFSLLIKNASRLSASEWINSYLTTEASVLLRTTHLSIKEITQILHFSDQSAFGKFFKRQKGISPLNFRNSKPY